MQLPNPPSEQDPRKYDESREEVGGYGGGSECRLSIQQKIVHEGEVNKARFMPQKPDMIATMCANGNVLVFDKTKHPLMPNHPTKCIPEMVLQGHTKEGSAHGHGAGGGALTEIDCQIRPCLEPPQGRPAAHRVRGLHG